MRPENKKALTLFELAVTLTIIGIFIAGLLTFIYGAAINAKRVVLGSQLKSLRLSLDLYKALKGQYPKDLRLLIQTKFSPGNTKEVLFGEKFLSSLGADLEGYPVDPFGKRFYYNHIEGVVKSQTKGYQDW